MAQIRDCASNKSTFKEYGGDMIFLLRNVVHTAGLFLRGGKKNFKQDFDVVTGDSKSHDAADDFHTALLCQAAQMLSDMMHRWIQDISLSEVEMHDILNIVEAMHVFKQLHIADARGVPPVKSIISCLTQKLGYPGNIPTTQSRGQRTSGPVFPERTTSDATGRTGGSSAERSEAARRRCASADASFNYEQVKERLAELLPRFDVNDMVGWDPSTNRVPMTHPSHCANCGTEHVSSPPASSSSSNVTTLEPGIIQGAAASSQPGAAASSAERCTQCRAQLRSRIDYGGLTDALVWSYLFETVDVPLVLNNAKFRFADIVELLPRVRRYLRLDELGHDFFQLQCYFLTHFIYVVSDWGRHSLRRELFREEFAFVVETLPTLVHHRDPELVGEFVQCLRIFNVAKRTDPAVWDLIEVAMRFLLEVERGFGSKGAWKKASSSVYDRYHSCFCGIVGLLVYDFYGTPLGLNTDDDDDTTKQVPIPRAFKFTGVGRDS
mmetsp:Transcript_10099/g.32996  ORF Transcript_10099/g.32996 Transcript_10099/m.32996 type:complete len:493 (-) Transcript_10099:563-2041(-)